MSNQRPALVICSNRPDEAVLKEIMAGIEEEGVLFQVVEMKEETDPQALALAGSKLSILGAGIGISTKEVKLAVREQLAPVILPVGSSPRDLGHNGAKYIKKKPLR